MYYSYNKTYHDKLRQCMGEMDRAYLKRFGELPFDTLDTLRFSNGYTTEEASKIVAEKMKIVDKQLIKWEEEQKAHEEARKREDLYKDYPSWWFEAST